jgi:glycosyltransferase involved in cell wall biosynthesis
VLEALSELGHQVDVLTFPVGEGIDISGVRVFRCANPFRIRSVPIGLSVRKVVLDATLVGALWRRLRHTRYDCIHAVEEAAFPAAWMGRGRGIPVIYDMQSSLPEQLETYRVLGVRPIQRVLRRCEAWLLARADMVISSTGLAQRVRESASKVEVREWSFPSAAPPYCDRTTRQLRAELGIPEDGRVVVYTGTFEPYQGLNSLLAAMPAVAAAVPEAVLVLVGATGGRAAELRQCAGRLVLNGTVRILPQQPRDRIPDYLAMADVLVSTRVYGGNVPLKIFDYMAAGRPIVATDIPTHRTLLNEERAVLVAPEPASIAEGITRVLQDQNLASSLTRAALAFAQDQLGWRAFVDGVNDAYYQLFAGEAPSTE